MGGGIIKKALNNYWDDYSNNHRFFTFTSMAKQFEHITKELIYIDMKELSSKNAYSTMQNVCSKIGIDDISKYKHIFSSTIANYTQAGIEKELYIQKDDNIPFEIRLKIVSYDQMILLKDTRVYATPIYKNFTSLIEKFSTIYLKEDLSIFVVGKNRKNIVRKIKNDEAIMNIIKAKITDYAKEAKNKIEIYNSLKFNENDILEYFKKDKDLRDKYGKLFEYETSKVKQDALQIVESWIYYKKFLENYKN